MRRQSDKVDGLDVNVVLHKNFLHLTTAQSNEYRKDIKPSNTCHPKTLFNLLLSSRTSLPKLLKQNKEKAELKPMAMKACFRLSTPTEASTFHSHHHPIFSKEKQSSSAFFSYHPPKSFHFDSTMKNKQAHFFVCRAKNIVDEVVEVTDETWKERVIDSKNPVIVLFWAPSCGPCKLVEPVVGDLTKEYAGKVACYKINTDDWLKIASEYGIRSIPTVLLFKDGKQKDCVIGAVRKTSLTTMLEKYL